MIKKYIALLIGVSVLGAASAALAENDVTVNAGVESISVKAVTDSEKNPLTLKVFRLNDDGNGGYTLGDIIHIDQRNDADTDTPATETVQESFTYNFDTFPAPESGKYRAIVGGNSAFKDFTVVSLADKRQYYKELSQKSADEIKAHIERGIAKDILPFDTGGYMSVTDTDLLKRINEALCGIEYPALAEDADADTLAEFEETIKPVFEEIIKIGDILNTSAEAFDALIKANAADLEIDTKAFYANSLYSINSEAVFKKLVDLKPSFGKAEFNKAFNAAVLLVIAKDCDYGTLTKALKYYDGKGIELNKTYASALSDAGLQEVSIEIKKNIASINSVAALENAYLNASVKIVQDKNNVQQYPPVGNSGGGGGSTGGGGGKIVFSPQISVPEKAPSADNDNSSELKKEDIFSDLNSVDWAKEAIFYLAKVGVISGRDSNIFAPEDNVTREEFVKMIVLAFGLENKGTAPGFTDVMPGRWSKEYIEKAASNGIVSGVTNTEFAPTENLSREQMAAIIYRLYSMYETEMPTPVTFDDDNEIKAYAKEPVGVLASVGIINGTGNNMFSPKSLVTRAQAAKIIYETLSAVGLVQ